MPHPSHVCVELSTSKDLVEEAILKPRQWANSLYEVDIPLIIQIARLMYIHTLTLLYIYLLLLL